jgi:hypothetical protein
MSAREPEPSRQPATPGRHHLRQVVRRSRPVGRSRAGNDGLRTDTKAFFEKPSAAETGLTKGKTLCPKTPTTNGPRKRTPASNP